jgi:cytochrome c oxidase assembly protein subunit 11
MRGLVAVVVGMVGLSYAAVPLYRIFCQVTGFAGTPQVAKQASDVVTDRVMKVRFDSMVNGLPWALQPVRREMRLRVGETGVAYYRAENLSDRPVIGTATFNVTPAKAGPYFNKVECFCFTEQRLEPGQVVEMPVSFFVGPEIETDINLDEVRTITLSYTFYPVRNDEKSAAASPGSVDRLLASTMRRE